MSPQREREEYDIEDSGGEEDGHDDHDLASEGGKGSSSSQVRKAQNRIAQREFRLRKQQYIRDLEARVEVLSGDKEERIELMTLLVRNLLKENKDLRGMVKSMASFVGEGLGSCLPRLGLSADGLDAILNRSDTDTAYEAFVNLKASKEQLSNNPGMKFGETRRRASTMKRKRDTLAEEPGGSESQKDKGKVAGSAAASKSKSGSGRSTPLNDNLQATNQPSFFSFQQPGEGDDYHYLFPDLDALLSEDTASSFPRASSSRPSQQPQVRPPPPIEEGDRFDPRAFPSGSGMTYNNGTRAHGYAQHIMPSSMGGEQSPTEDKDSAPISNLPNTGSAAIPASSGYLSAAGQMGYYDGIPAGNGLSTLPLSNLGSGSNNNGFGTSIPLNSPDSFVPGTSSGTGGPSGMSAENPISSLAGPRPSPLGIDTPGNYASRHPSILSDDPTRSTQSRQQSLREAVAAVTNTDNPLEGPGVTAAELAERRRQQDQLMRIIEEGDPADRKMETMQLITYHLNNFRMNHEYHLPPSLRPTVVQRTIPHEHAIDGIIFPSVRDRMILLRGRYDLVEVFHAMLTEFELHGDDVLDHNNYEISETFIENFSILIDDSVISISNKWRIQRGLSPLTLPDRETMGHPSDGRRIHAAQ